MNWIVDANRREAMTPEGYLITWAKHPKHGLYYNAWGPPSLANKLRKHLEAGFNRDKCKAACEAHLEKVSRETKAA